MRESTALTFPAAFAAALLLSVPGLRAQEEDNASGAQPLEKAVVVKPKLAIELGAPFCNNAVLQREMKVPVWGWSEPGRKITVTFAGQTKTATAGQDGKWRVELDPLKASFEPGAMAISDDQGITVTLKNILVGEVWMASGQSNMQWLVQKCDCAKLKLEAVGNVAPIREFEVTSCYAALHPIEHATGAWKDGNYGDYSAIAFAFAHKLQGELNVPIGILNCSFSQTSIQAWVPRLGFRDAEDAYTKAIYKQILETDPTTPEHQAAWSQFYADIEAALKEQQAIPTRTPGNLDGNRDASWMFNGRLNPVVPYAIRGAIWNQGYANMGEGLPYYNNLHSLVRGWRLVWDRPDLPVFFHQFYCPGRCGDWDGFPSIGSTAEMRLGTWLARDIPNAGMASQIDVEGAIHYGSKAVPGQRLALQALKNVFGRKIVADGPMFRDYTVDGSKLVVAFDHAEGGLVVAETGSNALGKEGTGFSDPRIVENGEGLVKLFYLADENRVWYPATVKIDGEKAIVSSPKVKVPRGVSYGTGGVGFQPNLYNRALLPTTPFVFYDHKLVKSESWPDKPMKIDGAVADPSSVGKLAEYRKMPLLSSQFQDNAVLQAGVPVPVWGSVQLWGEWGGAVQGKAEVRFSFGKTEKTIPVTPGMDAWQVLLPPMEASAAPQTLNVSFAIDGELVHERVCTNIVIGDVWYVAAPPLKMAAPQVKPSGQIVRIMDRKAKRWASSNPSRYSVAVSRNPEDNRFASIWEDAAGFAAAIGHSLAAGTRRPVGIIFMQSGLTSEGKGKPSVDQNVLKSWIPAEFLDRAPSLMADYKDLAAARPGTEYYAANARRYIAAWKRYWGGYVPKMIATKAVPDGVAWGSYPNLSSSITSKASETYNVLVCSFTPAAIKGIVFLSSPAMVAEDQGANFGEQVAVLGNSWKERFALRQSPGQGDDPQFFYTLPGKALAPKITKPAGIKGKSTAVEIADWSDLGKVIEAVKEKTT